VTQRNAALVQEAAAAAGSLKDQASQLRETVSVFNLSEDEQARRGGDGDYCEDLDFDEFVYAHKQWSKRLRRVIEGRSEPQDPAVVSCDDRCSLGQWIHGDGKRFANALAYQTLRAKHAQFHQSAGEVLTHVIHGERDQADAIFSGPFASLSKETIAQIRRLEHDCQGGHLAEAAALTATSNDQ
jgi:methyl-accepting chemotaxis protein